MSTEKQVVREVLVNEFVAESLEAEAALISPWAEGFEKDQGHRNRRVKAFSVARHLNDNGSYGQPVSVCSNLGSPAGDAGRWNPNRLRHRTWRQDHR